MYTSSTKETLIVIMIPSPPKIKLQGEVPDETEIQKNESNNITKEPKNLVISPAVITTKERAVRYVRPWNPLLGAVKIS